MLLLVILAFFSALTLSDDEAEILDTNGVKQI